MYIYIQMPTLDVNRAFQFYGRSEFDGNTGATLLHPRHQLCIINDQCLCLCRKRKEEHGSESRNGNGNEGRQQEREAARKEGKRSAE
jgi:hypothetical protein